MATLAERLLEETKELIGDGLQGTLDEEAREEVERELTTKY